MGFSLVKIIDGVTLQSTVTPKGAYNNAAIYLVGESVSYNGSSYVAIQTTTGNLPTDTTYWQLLALGVATGIFSLPITVEPSPLADNILVYATDNGGTTPNREVSLVAMTPDGSKFILLAVTI